MHYNRPASHQPNAISDAGVDCRINRVLSPEVIGFNLIFAASSVAARQMAGDSRAFDG